MRFVRPLIAALALALLLSLAGAQEQGLHVPSGPATLGEDGQGLKFPPGSGGGGGGCAGTIDLSTGCIQPMLGGL